MATPEPSDDLRGELREELVGALQRVPELAGRTMHFTALSGGITNRNFLIVAAGQAGRYVRRLAGNDTHLLGISREVEHAATSGGGHQWLRNRASRSPPPTWSTSAS